MALDGPELEPREAMECDVVIVGAGPAGLATAIRLKQLASEVGRDLSVVVLEKGSEVGAHILSGAVIDPIGLNRLIPDWREKGAPVKTPVTEDRFYYLGPSGAIRIPNLLMPPLMSNHGSYIVSLGDLVRWLGEQATGLGVDIYRPGLVQHTLGWPLDNRTGGGSFLYHYGANLVSVGFVVHLNYENPHLYPYGEFQRFKTHPMIRDTFEGGRRIAYGARAITEGGWQSIPQLAFPGGVLVGCAAGFVNVPRIKGSHNAILSGIHAAEAAFAAIAAHRSHDSLDGYARAVMEGPIARDLRRVRNAKPFLSRLGTVLGTAFSGADMWANTLIPGIGFGYTLRHRKPDHATLMRARRAEPIDYPKPDGVLTFDRLTDVAFSSTNHEEDQPVHLKVVDMERIEEKGKLSRFVINAQNCVHCKTCDIKDPNQNINWTVPEGGGGPSYSGM
jgi:flavin-dependent dehydrogenase